MSTVMLGARETQDWRESLDFRKGIISLAQNRANRLGETVDVRRADGSLILCVHPCEWSNST